MTSSRPEPNFHPQQLSPHCRDLYRPIFRHQDQGRSISARAEVVCVSMFYNCAAQQNDVTGKKTNFDGSGSFEIGASMETNNKLSLRAESRPANA